MLTQAVGAHWHAVVRDVLGLGFRARDIFTELDLAEMVSIVIAAPPNSSLRYFLDSGWSREAHLLANLAEQRAGIADLVDPYERPGLDERATPDDGRLLKADVMSWEEMDRLDELRRLRASSGVNVKKTKKVW